MVKIGDKVYIKVLDKYNFRGTILNIDGDIAEVEIPVYYGVNNHIIVFKDVNSLIKVPETIKEVEALKNKYKEMK